MKVLARTLLSEGSDQSSSARHPSSSPFEKKAFVLSTFFWFSSSRSLFLSPRLPKITYLCCVKTLPASLADEEAAALEVLARRASLLLLFKGAAAAAAADECTLCTALSPVAAGARPPGARMDAIV